MKYNKSYFKLLEISTEIEIDEIEQNTDYIDKLTLELFNED